MNISFTRNISKIALLLTTVLALSAPVFAQDATYEITVTNLTRAQIFAPPIAAVHGASASLFTPGEPASDELALMAEDGNSAPLAELLSNSSEVYGVATAGGPVLPGQSLTFEVTASGRGGVISVAGMLVTTNDAFFAAANVPAPWFQLRGIGLQSALSTVNAYAWDAGSEANTELCAEIPGPPCGNGGVRNTEGAEGFVHIHPGIHGGGDLSAADYDWRNPAASVRIVRVR